MGDVKIKEIISFTEDNVPKTRMVISERDFDKEIILEGKGSIKVAVEA